MRLAVVGAGIAGLATAYLAQRAHPDLDVVVLEAAAEPGGKARSSVQDGHLFDWGPGGFLTNAGDTLELALALGLQDRLRPASDAAARRYLYRDGGLRPLPTTLGAWLRSELLSPPGRLRALAEALLGGRARREESVHDFVARHFGGEAARVLAGVFVAGVAAGDARELSLDALFPRLRKLEATHGSVLRGMLAARRGAPPSARPSASVIPSDGRLTTLEGGAQALVDALSAALAGRVRSGVRVVGLDDHGRPGEGPIALRAIGAHGEEVVAADAVALAVPAYVAAELLAPTAPEAAAALDAIRYADVAVVALGFDRVDVPTVLDAAGVLVPRGQGVRALEVQWSSAVFPQQAPPGKVTLRVVAGGTLDPGFVTLGDDDLLASVRRDLERSMGIVAEPEAVRIVRWPRGIPQFTLGHAGRVEAARRAAAARWPRLALTGSYLSGVGLDDVVREARAAANRLAGVPRV
ncbi:MAG: protoporphyrinogen oxidase [Trueperaceae bacterium]